MRLSTSLFATSLLILCALAQGCKTSVDGRYPVSGSVAFGGAPMQSGQISFQAASEGLQSNSAAQVVDGKYNIPAEKGLLPGEYVVVFQCEEKTGETETINQGGGKTYEVEITRSFVPADWGFESTHKVTVKPGKNVFDFDVPRSDAPVAPPTLSGPSGA